MKQAFLVINPKAGMLKGCSTPEQVKEQLAGLKLEPEITITTTTTGLKKFINKVKREKPDIVLIAGGDGTTATILKGLQKEPVTFGLIPTGSTNNIGQSIGLTDDLEEVVDVINNGHTADMDFGLAGRQVFIESVGMGILAQIMDRVGEQDSKKEVLKIAAHTIAEVATHDHIGVIIEADGRHIETDTVWLTITNTGRAAATVVDPTSNVHDRMLELVYCEPLAITELGRYIMAFIRNSHIREKKFHRIRAKEFKLTMKKPVNLHIDGELKEVTTVTVKALPAAIKVFVP